MLFKLSTFFSGTDFTQGKVFTTTRDLGQFLNTRKKYSQMLECSKQDLESKTPIDFVNFLCKSFNVKVGRPLSTTWTMRHATYTPPSVDVSGFVIPVFTPFPSFTLDTFEDPVECQRLSQLLKSEDGPSSLDVLDVKQAIVDRGSIRDEYLPFLALNNIKILQAVANRETFGYYLIRYSRI